MVVKRKEEDGVNSENRGFQEVAHQTALIDHAEIGRLQQRNKTEKSVMLLREIKRVTYRKGIKLFRFSLRSGSRTNKSCDALKIHLIDRIETWIGEICELR